MENNKSPTPSKTIIHGCGLLNKIKLKLSDDEESIRGFLSVRVSNNNVISFNVYQNKTTSSGKTNPSFTAMKTVMDQYKDVTMVENISEADFVVIKESTNNYPHAKIYNKIKYDFDTINIDTRKQLNFISRYNNHNNACKMIFKMYGLIVEKVFNDVITCGIIDYSGKLTPIELINHKRLDINEGDILDVVGYIKEGLYEGYPSCRYEINNKRESSDYTLHDFEIAKQNYEEYIEELSSECPF